MLKGHVFKKQIFGNQMFALFINTFLDGANGISNDYKNKMAVTYSGSTLTVQSGAVCIQGRFLEEDTSTDISAGTDTSYCKLVIEIDLDKQNTETDFLQGAYKVIKSASAYPSLTQQNIVGSNSGVYQYELARFRTSTNGITDFTDMRTYLDFDSIYSAIRTEYRAVLTQLQQELASVEDGSAYVLKNNFQEYRILSNETSESEVTCNFVRRENIMFLYVEVVVQPNAVISKNITVNMPEWAKTSLSEYILAKSNYVVDYDYVNCVVKSYSDVRLYKNNNQYSLNVYATNKNNQYDSIQNFILVYPIVN